MRNYNFICKAINIYSEKVTINIFRQYNYYPGYITYSSLGFTTYRYIYYLYTKTTNQNYNSLSS